MDILLSIVGESIALGVNSLILGFCVKQMYKYQNIIDYLQSAPSLNIDSKLIEEVSKYPDGVIPYVVLRGSVKPLGSPLRSNHSAFTGVVQKVTIKEHVLVRAFSGFWANQSRTVHEVYNSTPFVITDGKTEVEVIDALSADLLDLDVVADWFEPISPSLIDHIYSFLNGIRQRGLQTTEEMLRDGTYVTAIGELSKNEVTSLKIQPPGNGLPLYLITTTKGTLLKKLRDSKDFLRILILVFGSIAVIISGRIIMKYISRRRKKEAESLMRQHLAIGRRERRSRARERGLSEALQCVVCMENPKEIILLPCGHICLCEDCSANINNRCPICRNVIESTAPAYIM